MSIPLSRDVLAEMVHMLNLQQMHLTKIGEFKKSEDVYKFKRELIKYNNYGDFIDLSDSVNADFAFHSDEYGEVLSNLTSAIMKMKNYIVSGGKENLNGIPWRLKDATGLLCDILDDHDETGRGYNITPKKKELV